jgi:hypothetical protein
MATGTLQDRGFHKILVEFKKGLSEKQQADFQFAELGDVYKAIHSVQKQQEKNGTLRYLNRIRPFLDAMVQFGKVLDTFANSSEFVPFIWVRTI